MKGTNKMIDRTLFPGTELPTPLYQVGERVWLKHDKHWGDIEAMILPDYAEAWVYQIAFPNGEIHTKLERELIKAGLQVIK